MRNVIAAAAFAIALGSTTLASAQMQPAPSSTVGTTVGGGSLESKGPTVWGILPWSGIGIGARFMLPLGIKPLLTNTNLRDSFALEFGVDYFHWSFGYAGFGDYSVNELVPVVGVMWNIWVNQQFAFYPKIELGWGFGWASTPNGYSGAWDYTGHRGFYPDGAAGILYKLNNGLTLRAEAGYGGLKGGVGWLY
jgi:hypothetical protein